MHNCHAMKRKMVDLVFSEKSARSAELLAEIDECPTCHYEFQSLVVTLNLVDKATEIMTPNEAYWGKYEMRLRRALNEVDEPSRAAFFRRTFASVRFRLNPAFVFVVVGLLTGLTLWSAFLRNQLQNGELGRKPIAPAVAKNSKLSPPPNDEKKLSPAVSRLPAHAIRRAIPARNEKRRPFIAAASNARNQTLNLFQKNENAWIPRSVAWFNNADHFEKSALLLRSFRNVETSSDETDWMSEKRRSRTLLYQNILLRRSAEEKGNAPAIEVLNDLEPILVDIANLPNNPSFEDIQPIKDRIRKKEIIARTNLYSIEASLSETVLY